MDDAFMKVILKAKAIERFYQYTPTPLLTTLHLTVNSRFFADKTFEEDVFGDQLWCFYKSLLHGSINGR